MEKTQETAPHYLLDINEGQHEHLLALMKAAGEKNEEASKEFAAAAKEIGYKTAHRLSRKVAPQYATREAEKEIADSVIESLLTNKSYFDGHKNNWSRFHHSLEISIKSQLEKRSDNIKAVLAESHDPAPIAPETVPPYFEAAHIEGIRAEDPAEIVGRKNNLKKLAAATEQLPERMQDAIQARLDEERKTFTQKWKISDQRTSDIQEQAIAKLRTSFSSPDQGKAAGRKPPVTSNQNLPKQVKLSRIIEEKRQHIIDVFTTAKPTSPDVEGYGLMLPIDKASSRIKMHPHDFKQLMELDPVKDRDARHFLLHNPKEITTHLMTAASANNVRLHELDQIPAAIKAMSEAAGALDVDIDVSSFIGRGSR